MNIFKKLPWEIFFEEKIKKIFTDKKYIVDMGGGLRIDPKRNNRKKENPWLEQYITKVKYVVFDKVLDYNPDIVGDVCRLPFEDESVEAVLAMNLLEHVEDPLKAMNEIYRVLKPGGYAYFDTPFIFYYHPMEGYYQDFYRFSRDAWKHLCKDYASIEIQNVHGAISTAMNMFPIFSKRTIIFDILDILFGKQNSHQTSAYRVFCIK